jgi:large subunit ribosomal protein L25
MTKHYALEAEARTKAGKGAARALRREGKIPAVIYGDKKEPVGIALPLKEITLEYQKGHMFTTLCDIAIGKDKHQVLARDVQVHPVSDVIEHVDFLRVSDNTKLTVNIPVHLENYEDSKAAVGKGVINMVRHEVELVCLAKNIPDQITIDMAGAEIGDIIKISDVTLPKGATPAITDRDFTVLTVMAPKRAVDVEETADKEGEAAGEAEGGAASEGDAE